MPVFVIGLSHRTSPVELREQFAFPESAIPATLAKLRQSGLAQEGVILSTCNRVELYAVAPGGPGTCPALQRFLLETKAYAGEVNDEVYALSEPHSIEHLFRVACGLDSMVLGETEILGQLKRAYDLALQHKHTGGILNKAFQKAFNVAKQVRTETNIQRGSISVASVAVELAEKIFMSVSDRAVMIIGAGETGEKTAKALLSRGAKRILVSNRSHDRAVTLAQALRGEPVPFDDWASAFEITDIVISSTSAPHYILDRNRVEMLIKPRGSRPLLLVDIAVPRDIDPEVNFLENVYLYNVDDLQTIADSYLKQRQEEICRCEAIIREKVKGLASTLPPLGGFPRAEPCVS